MVIRPYQNADVHIFVVLSLSKDPYEDPSTPLGTTMLYK